MNEVARLAMLRTQTRRIASRLENYRWRNQPPITYEWKASVDDIRAAAAETPGEGWVSRNLYCNGTLIATAKRGDDDWTLVDPKFKGFC